MKGVERKAESHGNRKCLVQDLAIGERRSTSFSLSAVYIYRAKTLFKINDIIRTHTYTHKKREIKLLVQL